jgi:hypothetical protein
MVSQPASATGNCGSYCSGADSSSGVNIEGNNPQDYGGEVGTYLFNFGGTGGPCPAWTNGMCFNTAGAANAITRWSQGGGIGVFYYYLTAGPASTRNPGYDSYCWGWEQGYEATLDAYDYYGSYLYDPSPSMMVLDLDDPVSNYGWYTYPNASEAAANRLVFNGFTDWVAGRTSADSNCAGQNGIWWFQYMLYGNPSTWQNIMPGQSSIPNTPIWTTEPNECTGSVPNTMSPAASYNSPYDWGGYSNYLEDWQFQTCTGYDYDEGYNGWYMPVFGYNMN